MNFNGIIVIDKEQNMTSHDVVSRVRRILGTGKVGHTGTLDPMATGVLPICVGKATRIMEYLDMDFKTYRCSMLLGKETDSRDVWGGVLSSVQEAAVNEVREEEIREVFSSFRGLISQKPPIYSAVRVDGKRLYEYAREGKDVEIPSRNVYIKQLEIEEVGIGKGYESSVTFSVTCSKGTYIRSICHDAGEKLGVHAAMSALRRTASGVAKIEHALTLDELENSFKEEDFASRILRIPEMLVNFGELNLAEEDAIKFVNGLRIPTGRCEFLKAPAYADGEFVIPVRKEFAKAYVVSGIFNGTKTFLGVAFADSDGRTVKADKVFRPEISF